MRLLIIEDEQALHNALRKGFEKSGYAVDTAMDGEAALECFYSASYDVIILDLNLPKMDGLEVLEEIRKEDRTTNVLVLSARSEVEDKITGLDLGANDYLAKPFSFKELHARVRALALNLLEKGARVAAVDLNEEGLKDLQKAARGYGERFYMHVMDLTDKTALNMLPKIVENNLGTADGIINVAGIIQPFLKVSELDDETIKKVMDINFYGTLNMIQAFLPGLKKRPRAHIVNISSMGGFLPVPGQTVYGASKAAVKLLTEGLYSELKDTNVSVTVAFPGAVGTDIAKNSGVDVPPQEGTKQHKTLSPYKAAETIIEAMEKNKFRVLVGSDAKVMDFLYRAMPKRATNMIAKKMASLLEKQHA